MDTAVATTENDIILTRQVNVRHVPADLWQRFKIQAAVEGITIQAALTKAIRQYVTAA